MNDHITSGTLATELGISNRQATETFAKLESFGFRMQRNPFGGRKMPRALADALIAVRAAKRPLESLLDDPTLAGFRRPDGPADSLALLIEARTDASVLRELIGKLIEGLESDGCQIEPPEGWRGAGLDDPRWL